MHICYKSFSQSLATSCLLLQMWNKFFRCCKCKISFNRLIRLKVWFSLLSFFQHPSQSSFPLQTVCNMILFHLKIITPVFLTSILIYFLAYARIDFVQDLLSSRSFISVSYAQEKSFKHKKTSDDFNFMKDQENLYQQRRHMIANVCQKHNQDLKRREESVINSLLVSEENRIGYCRLGKVIWIVSKFPQGGVTNRFMFPEGRIIYVDTIFFQHG